MRTPKQLVNRCPKRRCRATRSVESLEPRALLDSAGLVWNQRPYLTASFAPDGTDVNGHASELSATLASLGDETAWQATILRAFQTWAIETNADVGLVADSGDPFGIPGATRRDARFGDVRIAAVPLPLDVLAVSVPNETIAAGTWVGDVLFNSAAAWSSMDDLYSVALHEAGHVFTLDHSDDPTSPMFVHGISANLTPIASDVAALQQRYGARTADANETARAAEGISDNDTLANATDLKLTKMPGYHEGAGPSLVYGDITTDSDVDYFFMPAVSDYAGQVTFTLRSDAISLLSPRLKVFNEDGVLLAEAESDYPFGDFLSLTIDRLGDDGGYYIAASGAVDGPMGRGGYSLVATWDAMLQTTAEQIDAVASGAYRFLSQEQLQDMFEKPAGGYLNDDGHADDEYEASAELDTSPGFAEHTQYEVVGSISGGGDRDYYKLKSPAALAAGETLYVSIHSLDAGRLWPRIQVFDEDELAVATTTLVDGGGDVVVQIDGVAANQEYFVAVDSADSYGLFAVGNYRLEATFSPASVLPQNFADGTLTSDAPTAAHTLYVGQTQLFHFILSATTAATTAPTSVWAVVQDADGNIVYSLAAPTGTTRTGESVVLSPGEYTIALTGLALDRSSIGSIDYALSGFALSEPVGPDPQDPTGMPNYNCPDNSGAYCYPGGVMTLDPFLWSSLQPTIPNPPTLDPAQLSSLLLGDWWSWLWATAASNPPPTTQTDIYNTATDAPLSVDAGGGVLANDASPGVLAAIVQSPAQHGTLQLNYDGSFNYRPDVGFTGVDQFQYLATDFAGVSVATTVEIVVTSSSTAGNADLNGDGRVGLVDLAMLQSAFGLTGPAGSVLGDITADGIVDRADAAALAKEFGQAVPAPSPSPSSPANAIIAAAVASHARTDRETIAVEAKSRRRDRVLAAVRHSVVDQLFGEALRSDSDLSLSRESLRLRRPSARRAPK
jgi:hypothetical protein